MTNTNGRLAAYVAPPTERATKPAAPKGSVQASPDTLRPACCPS